MTSKGIIRWPLWRSRGATSGALCLLLHGCSTVYEGKYDFDDGWREASVVAVGAVAVPAPVDHRDCRLQSASSAHETRYVTLTYRRVRAHGKLIMPLPEGMDLKPGDVVYVNAARCAGPILREHRSPPEGERAATH
jgi:hypothetical protein